MKVLHVVFGWSPDTMGGTEIYVRNLAEALTLLGVESDIAAPGDRDEVVQVEALRMLRYCAVPSPSDLESRYALEHPSAEAAFSRLLAGSRPDVVHFHALSPAVTPGMAERARAAGASVAYTYHTPTATCPRGTLMRWGRIPCDGTLRPHRCAACTLHGRGAPRPLALLASSLPAPVGRLASYLPVGKKGATALRLPALLDRRRRALRRFLAAVERTVSPVPWANAVLHRNGVSPLSIVASGQGVPAPPAYPSSRDRGRPSTLRIAFLGRLDPTKGATVLVDGVCGQPQLSLELDLYGLPAGSPFEESILRERVAQDARIRILPPVSPQEARELLVQYDLIAVPSQWLETGPLVVLEAQAAGLPVLGSNLGGIAHRVRHRVDGWLVDDFRDPAAWGWALQRLVEDPDLLQGLRAGVVPPRSMRAVAQDMAALYRQLRSAAT